MVRSAAGQQRLDRTARTRPCHLCACISAAVTRLHSGWQVRTRGFTADEALGIKTAPPLYRDVTAFVGRPLSTHAKTLVGSGRGWSLMSVQHTVTQTLPRLGEVSCTWWWRKSDVVGCGLSATLSIALTQEAWKM